MTDSLWSWMILAIYMSSVLALGAYGINCYVMIWVFRKSYPAGEAASRENLAAGKAALVPVVTTQIPIYNEINVAERIIRAVCCMEYPSGYHEIQVLDDSTDETREIIDGVVESLRKDGHDINIVRREDRVGFKAGALAHGIRFSRGELFAVFDADFVPPRDFLLKTVSHFIRNSRLGLVQARWGHLNKRRSAMTRAQSIGIDGHFMVEQCARNYGGLFMNFNGTAGLFRKQAIEEGGGWQWDTLTEDMDLSYRVQFAGWETLYLPDLVVPAELPEDMVAFKSQQFRWAKGSIQTALKLFPQIIRYEGSLFKKVEAFFHLTHYMVHPLMLTVSVLALPVILTIDRSVGPVLVSILAALLIMSMAAPSSLYVVSQRHAYRNWVRRIAWLPFLVVMGVGIAVSNSRAVAEAMLGIKSDFIRTPKRGEKEHKKYSLKRPVIALVEVFLGLYCSVSLGIYLAAGKYLVGPFLAVYAAGFLFVGFMTIAHSVKR